MAGSVAQGLLGDAEDTFLRAGRQTVVSRQVTKGYLHVCPGAVAERLALVAQRLAQPHPFQRRGGELLQKSIHLDHGFLRTAPHIAQGFPRTLGIGVPAGLHGSCAHDDAKDLLLDRIVQVACQAVALLLGGRLAGLAQQVLAQLADLALAGNQEVHLGDQAAQRPAPEGRDPVGQPSGIQIGQCSAG